MSRLLTPAARFGSALAAALALGAGAACAGAPDAVPPSTPVAEAARAYTFAFQDAEIAQVVQEVLGQAGAVYSLDPGVNGKLTFRIEQSMTRDQLLAALEAVLAANGVAMVREGDIYHITPQAKAKTQASIRPLDQALGGAGYEIVAVPMAYAQPSEVAKAMKAISEDSAVIYSDDKLGFLLLGGSGSQLKLALETIKTFDQNLFEDSKLRWFELTQAQASTVASEAEKIVEGSGLSGVHIIPLKRLNGVIVFARSTQTLDEIGKWVRRLDGPGREVTSSLWVYRPRNTSAESLARTLSSVLGIQSREAFTSTGEGGSTQAAQTPVLSPALSSAGTSLGQGDEEVRVGVDKDTNTLLLFAAPARWIQIQRILNEVDRPAKQIFIEASILEVTLGKDFQFGVDWSAVSKELSVSSINSNSGEVGPSYPGLAITYLSGDIDAAVKALGSRTSVEVVSAPKILALDNRTARLQIGDQVPVVVQSSQSTSASNAALVSTVDYRNTGVILTVTPRVTGEDQVVLEVSQEVSLSTKTSTSGIDSPTIQQRRFESSLILHSGGVVALGGLINSNRSVSRSGVPLLKEIPGLGLLFSANGKNESRSELVVLLTAKIIDDQTSSDRAMSDLTADMRELQSRGLLPTSPRS